MVRTVRMFTWCLVGLVHVGLSGLVRADTLLVDPHIPHGERAVYRMTQGEESHTVQETVGIKEVEGKQLYEFKSRSEAQDITVELAKATMATTSVHAIRRVQGAIFDLRVTMTDDALEVQEDTVALADASALLYLLRGFPFETLKHMKMHPLRSGNGRSVTMTVKFKGRDQVKLSSGVFDCYRLDIRLDSVWARLVPTTHLWYSVAAPHYLVRFEGPGGPPGSPKRVLELVEYGR